MSARRVYIAQERGGGLCKIGYSATPERRVLSLVAATAIDLDLAYSTPVHDWAPTIERMAHILLRSKAKGNYILLFDREWFRVSVPEAMRAITRATRLVNAALERGIKTSSSMYRQLESELREERCS